MNGFSRFIRSLSQYGVAIGVISGMFGTFALVSFFPEWVINKKQEERVVKTKINTVDPMLPHVTQWNYQMEQARDEDRKKIADLEKLVIKGAKKNDHLEQQLKQAQLDAQQNKADEVERNARLEKQMDDRIKEKLSSLTNLDNLVENGFQKSQGSKTQVRAKKIEETNAPYRKAYEESSETTQHVIKKPTFGQKASSFSRVGFQLNDDPSDIVLAGDVISATLLNGVTASTAVEAAKQPRPVNLEITKDHNFPGWFEHKLKKCRITGAAYGDISSERVYIRLEKLSCTRRDTIEKFEQVVDGYVIGNDGQVGVRGKVVIRNRELLVNAMVGGFLGGMSKILSQQSAPIDSFNLLTGNANRNQSATGMLKQVGAEGTANALDRYTKYYIDRLERILPVIQISAGLEVSVVFRDGFTLGKGTKSARPVQVAKQKTYVDDAPYTVQGKQSNQRRVQEDGEDYAKSLI